MVPEGSYVWGRDNRFYVVQGGRLVPTIYSRTFPNPYYPSIYDLYANGRYVRRVGAFVPQTVPIARQPTNAAAQLYQLISQLNQLVSQQASTGRALASGSYVGGFSLNTPNENPLTVGSMHTQAILNSGSPIGQALAQTGFYPNIPNFAGIWVR